MDKIKKEKIPMYITLGVIGAILTSVIFVQFKTIGQTDINEMQSKNNNELKTDIANLKTKYDDTMQAIADTNKKMAEYQDKISSGKEASDLLQKELKKTSDLSGVNAAAGPGVAVTLADTASKKIDPFDILDLLNDLKGAGVEAISVNDQRIVYNSYVVDIGGTFISIDGERLISPYVVKAIGDSAKIESVLSEKQYGYIDTLTSAGKSVAVQKQDNVTIPAYSGNLNFNYAKEAGSN
ncbi:MAG: DUF881 domain-containing protein [Firmicutes bacterium]|nr:DUF881 domain-containing protein [Bacillota bacterium]